MSAPLSISDLCCRVNFLIKLSLIILLEWRPKKLEAFINKAVRFSVWLPPLLTNCFLRAALGEFTVFDRWLCGSRLLPYVHHHWDMQQKLINDLSSLFIPHLFRSLTLWDTYNVFFIYKACWAFTEGQVCKYGEGRMGKLFLGFCEIIDKLAKWASDVPARKMRSVVFLLHHWSNSLSSSLERESGGWFPHLNNRNCVSSQPLLHSFKWNVVVICCSRAFLVTCSCSASSQLQGSGPRFFFV